MGQEMRLQITPVVGVPTDDHQVIACEDTGNGGETLNKKTGANTP
jgi:hypothetical protein